MGKREKKEREHGRREVGRSDRWRMTLFGWAAAETRDSRGVTGHVRWWGAVAVCDPVLGRGCCYFLCRFGATLWILPIAPPGHREKQEPSGLKYSVNRLRCCCYPRRSVLPHLRRKLVVAGHCQLPPLLPHRVDPFSRLCLWVALYAPPSYLS